MPISLHHRWNRTIAVRVPVPMVRASCGERTAAAETSVGRERSALIGRAAALVLWVAGLLAGCATLSAERPPPVTVSEIVEMSHARVPPREIIEQIRASGTVYRLKASQLAELREKGVPDAVIDYMQQTYLHAVRRDQRFRDWSHWTLYDDGYWYGGYPFGWPAYGWIDEDIDLHHAHWHARR